MAPDPVSAEAGRGLDIASRAPVMADLTAVDYETPIEQVGRRRGALVYLHDEAGLTVTSWRTERFGGWPRLERALTGLLVVGVLALVAGAWTGAPLTFRLTAWPPVTGTGMTIAGLYLALAAGAAIVVWELLHSNHRWRVTLQVRPGTLEYRRDQDGGLGATVERWTSAEIDALTPDPREGLWLSLRDGRRLKLHLGRSVDESSELAENVERVLAGGSARLPDVPPLPLPEANA